MPTGGYTYLMTNRYNKTLYIGVTSNLKVRVYQHKTGFDKGGFTHQYNVNKLVYYEAASSIQTAIAREKQIKGWTRAKKEVLIATMNPDWRDLYDDLD